VYIHQHQCDALPDTIRRILMLGIMTCAAYRMFKAWKERRYQEDARTILGFLAAGESSLGDLIADLSLCIEPEDAERCIKRMAAEGLVLVPVDQFGDLPSCHASCSISREGRRAIRRA
jgi:hypothetical protein